MNTVTTQKLKELKEEKNIPLINVLSEEQFERAHIPGSVNIPASHDDFVGEVEKRVGGKDQPVVVYCASAECDASPSAARKLEEAGFTDVYDYEGGTQSWKQSGMPVEGGEQG